MTQPGTAKQWGKIIVRVDPDIEDLIPVFLDKLEEEIQAVPGLLDRTNYEEVRTWGHSLKGAGSGYGFDFVTQIGQSIELAAKAQDPEEVRRLVAELSTYLEWVEVVY
jgi:HPt (histidine-containing phosphotransfer) domain-containing protein